MDNWISTYTHNGVSYTRDNYNGTVMPSDVYNAIAAANSAAFSAYRGAAETAKIAKEIERMATDPVYRAKVLAKDKKAKASAAKREAKLKANTATRKSLLDEANKMAEKMVADGVVVTEKDVETWRIANGYLWKVVSPKGNVYTEVLKSITIDCPDEYVTYNAMVNAMYKSRSNV